MSTTDPFWSVVARRAASESAALVGMTSRARFIVLLIVLCVVSVLATIVGGKFGVDEVKATWFWVVLTFGVTGLLFVGSFLWKMATVPAAMHREIEKELNECHIDFPSLVTGQGGAFLRFENQGCPVDLSAKLLMMRINGNSVGTSTAPDTRVAWLPKEDAGIHNFMGRFGTASAILFTIVRETKDRAKLRLCFTGGAIRDIPLEEGVKNIQQFVIIEADPTIGSRLLLRCSTFLDDDMIPTSGYVELDEQEFSTAYDLSFATRP